MGQGFARRHERGVQIVAGRLPPARIGKADRGARAVTAGIGHQDIEGAELPPRRLDGPPDVARFGGVAGHGERADRLGGLPERLRTPAHDHRPSAVGNEAPGDGRADTGAAARDQRDLSAEAHACLPVARTAPPTIPGRRAGGAPPPRRGVWSGFRLMSNIS